MRSTDALPRTLGAAVIAGLVALGPAAAQPLFNPEVGQAGKDVIWVPTADALVEKMLDVAQVTSNDYVIDLGSGDGRTVIAAAKRGARARGIEYEPAMVELSIRNARNAGVGDRAKFDKADLFETDFSQATVVTMFLLPDINLRLRPKILDLKAGTRVVSNSFTMGEWTPDQTFRAPAGCTHTARPISGSSPPRCMAPGGWRTANSDSSSSSRRSQGP
jgi:SAM-dependent methyltransferase